MNNRFHLKIDVDSAVIAIDALALRCDLSRSEIKKAMNCGAVWLTRSKRKRLRLRRAKHALASGDILELYYDRSIVENSPVTPVLLDSDHDYSIWYKPPLLLSQGSNYGDHLSLLRIAEKLLKLKQGPFLVHRLDREASGLMILAHSKKSAASLSHQFQSRRVRKIYRAKVHGKIVKRRNNFEINDSLDGKHASTNVSIVSFDPENNVTELMIKINTGRYHQIRKHLSMIGHPVCNDRKYAKEKPFQGPLNLCAVELSFYSPRSGEKVSYLLPDDLIEF